MARSTVARMIPITDRLHRGVLFGGIIWIAALLPSEWLTRFYFDQPMADILPRLILDLSFSALAGTLAVLALERRRTPQH